MEKSLCSIFSILGTISLTANSSAVWPTSRCCSVKSSGVKTSSGRRSSSRKLPPDILELGTAVVAIIHPFLTTEGTEEHRGNSRIGSRSEERRVGKECRDRRTRERE